MESLSPVLHKFFKKYQDNHLKKFLMLSHHSCAKNVDNTAFKEELFRECKTKQFWICWSKHNKSVDKF